MTPLEIKKARIFILFNALLSAIGIFAAMAAAKIDQYGNPLLIALPLSNVLWFFFAVFAKIPDEKYFKDKEKMEAVIIAHANSRLPNALVLFFIEIIKGLIIALFTIILLTDFAMMTVIALKTAIACPSFIH